MKKIFLALGLLLICPQLAEAQSQRNPCYYPSSTSTSCIPVSTTNPLPVTGGGGGLSVTDQTVWSQGTSAFTPTGGVYNDTATLTSGQEGTVRLTTKRAIITDVDTTGNALYTALTAGSGSATGGTAAVSSALIGGVYNATPPTLTDGQQAGAQFDTRGNLKITQGTGSNIYVGTYTLGTFVQPTVTASSAYASGNVVGGKLTFPSAARAAVGAGGTGMLTSVVLDFQDAQTGSWDLVLFDADPSSSTFTDKTAVSVAAADVNKIIKVVHIADCTSVGTTSTCQADGIGKNYSTTATTNLYGVLVTRNTPTFSVTNDVMIRLFGQEN